MHLPAEFLRIPLAHRALHDAALGIPENSLAAVNAAVDAGYAIELDVQLSSDDEAMVFHDDTLDRMTAEAGPVRARPAGEHERTGLRGDMSGGAIPRLSTVLKAVAGRVPILVEIKDQDGALGPVVGPLEEAVARAIRGYRGPIAVMSFNPNAVARMAELLPEVPRGLTTGDFHDVEWHHLPHERRALLHAIDDASRYGVSFISHQASDLDRAPVAAFRARGLPVLTWTIRSPEEEAAARRFADNITFEGYRPAIPPAPGPGRG